MFDGVKIKSKGSNLQAADPPVSKGKEPSKRQIYQSRYNFGVNLGACFVLEKWIYHDLFVGDAEVEFDAVQQSIKELGEDETRKKFEDHWSSFMDDNDWKWLQDHDVNSVRVPLGYWEIDGGKFTKGTQFDKVASKIYANAWKIFKEKFVEPAGKHNISVIIDLHGLPGGANTDAHSGEKNSGVAKFWDNSDDQLQMLDLFKFIAKDVKNYDNIAAIQIVNESAFSNDPKHQQQYYAATINAIRGEDKSVPVIVSDGWWPDQIAKWVQHKQDKHGNLGVVVDHHCYRCASDDDKKKSPSQIIQDLDGDLLTNINDDGKGVDFVIGEYSCVLDEESWKKADGDRNQLVGEFAKKQLELFKQRPSFGSYFWTYKFQEGSGGEWDFKNMVDSGVIGNPLSARGKNLPDENKFKEALDQEYGGHSDYWDKQGGKYEHERFKDGFTTGWKDAESFAKFEGSVLGRREAWKDARKKDHISDKGDSKNIWEWEHGYTTGIRRFNEAL